MTDETVGVPGESADEPDERLLHAPLLAFLAALRASRDLEEFIGQTQKDMLSVEAVFTRIASRRMPSVDRETHQKAAATVHTLIHERMDSDAELRSRDASEDEFRDNADQYEQKINAAIIDLTGRPEDNYHYSQVWRRTTEHPSGARVLRSSLLISLVSDFEVLISSLVRAQLMIRPEIMRSSDQAYTLRDLEPFKSMEDFRRHCAERTADNLLRGGFEDWMEWFAKRHKVVAPGVTHDSEALLEIFQRRHLFVHNGGLVNDYYLARVAGSSQSVGDSLQVGHDYLVGAIDTLTAAGVKIAVALSQKLFVGIEPDKDRDSLVTRVAYDLLQDGLFEAVKNLSEWHLGFVENDESRLVSMVNAWLARKALDGLDSVRTDIESWDTSTLAGRFKLVKLALLDEHAEAHALSQTLLTSGELAERSWHTWPVLEQVRAFAASRGGLPSGGSLYEVGHVEPLAVGQQSSSEPSDES